MFASHNSTSTTVFCRPSSAKAQYEAAAAAAEDSESTEELAARLQRIQAAASYAEGYDSDADAEQARATWPPVVMYHVHRDVVARMPLSGAVNSSCLTLPE